VAAHSAKRILAIVFCLSVCLSVATQYWFKPRWDRHSRF